MYDFDQLVLNGGVVRRRNHPWWLILMVAVASFFRIKFGKNKKDRMNEGKKK